MYHSSFMWQELKRALGFRRPPARSAQWVQVDFGPVDAAIAEVDNLLVPDWDAIARALHRQVKGSDYSAAQGLALRHWVNRLAASLGDAYQVAESDHFVLLSPLGEGSTRATLKLSEHAYAYLINILGGLPRGERFGKIPILMFDHRATYTAYLNALGLHTTATDASLGVFIQHACPQIAVDVSAGFDFERILVHELSHAVCSGLRMPRWVDEGIAQVAEEYACGTIQAVVTPEQQMEHRDFWSQVGLYHFWNGDAFDHPDMQPFAYQLANVLIRNLHSMHRRQFTRFVVSASVEDGGEAAAQVCLERSLPDIAAVFLGDGYWR